MKTMNKQEADYSAVIKFLEDNKGTSLKEAISHTAKAHKKNAGTVQASYYRMHNKNKPKAAVAAPVKKKPVTRKTTKPNGDIDLNVLRSTLNEALRTIDQLEIRNNQNAKIVSDLRTALSV